MILKIELTPNHVALCRKWASMRRTLEEAKRLLDPASTDPSDVEDDKLACIGELDEIIPTIEALQFAVRGGQHE